MSAVLEVLAAVAGDVWVTIAHNWPYLLAAVVVAAALQVYLGTDHLAAWLRRRTGVAVLAAVAVASLTPFCSCGTTAVVLGAMASAVPWAPVVAFMVSSPLTSPGEYVMSAGLFGPAFATTYFVAAIVIGLAAGGMTALVERTGWLVGQARMATPSGGAVVGAVGGPVGAGSRGTTLDGAAASCGCDDGGAVPHQRVDPGGRTSLALLDAPTGWCAAVGEPADDDAAPRRQLPVVGAARGDPRHPGVPQRGRVPADDRLADGRRHGCRPGARLPHHGCRDEHRSVLGDAGHRPVAGRRARRRVAVGGVDRPRLPTWL